MTINQITPKFAIVDKFLVSFENEEATIKNFDTYSKYVPNVVRNEVANSDLYDLRTLFFQYRCTSIIPIESEDIFTVCPPKDITFYVNSNGDAFTPSSREGRAMEDKDEEVVMKVIQVRLGPKRKYLYHKKETDDVIDQLDKVTIAADIHHSKDISFYQSVLRLDQFKFSEADMKLISEMFLFRYQPSERTLDMFTTVYLDVRENFSDFRMARTIAGVSTKDNFPKEIQPSTFVNYGRDATFLMLAVEDFAEFQFAKKLNIKYLPFDRTKNTDAKYVSDYFVQILSDKKYSAYWMTLVKLCAFNWKNINNDDDNKTVNEVTSRHTLDAIKAYVTYVCLYKAGEREDVEAVDLFRDDGSASWEWLKDIYHKLVKSAGNNNPTQVSILNNETVVINGKPFSRAYIQLFVKNVADKFELNLKELKKYYKNVRSVEDIKKTLLLAPNILYSENRGKQEVSFLDLFKEHERKPMFARMREGAASDKKTILKLLGEMGVCIMWMMYFDLSGPARFPELLVLKYAGNDRNAFMDASRRNFDIHFKYSKSHAFPSIVRSLDKYTSAYLMHFIVVERMMMRECLGVDYCTASRDLFGDLKGDDRLHSIFGAQMANDHLSDPAYSNTVAQTFLFFDPSTGGLISREKFSKFYKEYPNVGGFMPATRLNLREIRKAMVAMIRGCVPVEKESFMIEAARELSAGHSVNTAFKNYGVDSFLGLGSETNLMSNFILRACRVWHSWLGLGSVNTVDDLEEEIEDKKVLEIEGACSNDLTVAGVRIFGRDFQFKISQRRIATDLYLSGKKFFPIQALPGYGKTALFELPLVAMKLRQPTKRICSFVFVPYISLMANMIDRLSKHGLKCKAVKDILVWNNVPEEVNLDADIYVCSYEDVTSDCLKTMINNWYYEMNSEHREE